MEQSNNEVESSKFHSQPGSIRFYNPQQKQVPDQVLKQVEHTVIKKIKEQYSIAGKLMSIWYPKPENQNEIIKIEQSNKYRKALNFQRVKFGNAFAISPYLVLTCLSNVYSSDKRLPNEIIFIKAYAQQQTPQKRKARILNKKEIESKQILSKNPLIILQLEQPLIVKGQGYPTFGSFFDFGPEKDQNFCQENTISNQYCSIMAVGHTLTLKQLRQLEIHEVRTQHQYYSSYEELIKFRQVKGIVHSLDEQYMYYQMNDLKGFQGCPLFVKNNQNEILLIGMQIQHEIQENYGKEGVNCRGLYFNLAVLKILNDKLCQLYKEKNMRKTLKQHQSYKTYIQETIEGLKKSKDYKEDNSNYKQLKQQLEIHNNKNEIKTIEQHILQLTNIRQLCLNRPQNADGNNSQNQSWETLLRNKKVKSVQQNVVRNSLVCEAEISTIKHRIQGITRTIDDQMNKQLKDINLQSSNHSKPHQKQNKQSQYQLQYFPMRLNKTNNYSIEDLREIIPLQYLEQS